jgi:putative oxidoreductase
MSGRRESLILLIRLALGGVFLYAGIIKIADPFAVAGSVASYRILPYFGNYLAAAVIPWLEAICGLLLVTGWRVRGATAIVLLLNLLFMAALASSLVRGLDIDCGCFRQGGEKGSAWIALFRDCFFLAGAVILLRNETKRPSLQFRGK